VTNTTKKSQGGTSTPNYDSKRSSPEFEWERMSSRAQCICVWSQYPITYWSTEYCPSHCWSIIQFQRTEGYRHRNSAKWILLTGRLKSKADIWSSEPIWL